VKSFREKTITGLLWVFAEKFTSQFITFLVSAMMARVLAPAEFGLVAMVGVFVAVADSLKDAGMATSLVRMSAPTEDDFNSVFTVNFGLSIALYLLLFVLAPSIASFFEQPELVTILRLMALRIIFNAVALVQYTRLTKSMRFREQLTIQVPALLLSGAVGIGLAWMGYGVWSIVAQHLCQAAFAALQLWIRFPWKPSFHLIPTVTKFHFRFGYKLALAGILDTLFQQAYNLIIGKYFTAAELGFYTRANATKQLPVTNVSLALNKVTLPLFSELKEDTMRVRAAYKKLMHQVLFWLAPVMGLGIITGEQLFRMVFTEKWLPAVPMFQILCLAGVLYPLHSYNLNILKANGRSDLFLRLEVVKKMIGLIVMIGSLPFGIMGLIWGQVLFSGLVLYVNGFFSGRLIGYSISAQLKDLLPIFALAGTLCFTSDFVLKRLIHPAGIGDFWYIVISSAIVFVLYLTSAALLNFDAFVDARQIIMKRR
jgi:O-antigen/teichoic acid export membrane protein